MSSQNSPSLACMDVLALNTMVKLHQKHMVVSLSVERLDAATNSLLVIRLWVQGQEGDGVAEKCFPFSNKQHPKCSFHSPL